MARKRLEVEIAGDAASAEAALGGLGASLDALSDKRIEIKADDTALRRAILEDRELIASLGTEEGRARLGLDDDQAKAKIAELKADIDSIGLKRARLSVDDAEARAKILGLKAEMDTLRDKDVHIDVDRDGSAVSKLSGLGKAFDDTANKIPPMVAAAGLLGPAIVPAAAAAAAGVGALLVPLTAATFGFGALGVLALPTLMDVKTGVQGVTTAQDALTKVQDTAGHTTAQLTTAQNNLNAAWAKLTPIEADVVHGVLDLKKEMQFLSASMQPQILGAFNTFLNDGKKLLPQLVAPAKEAALALNDLGTSVSKGLDSPAWHHFMDVITPEIRPAIDSIGRSFGNLVKGLGGVVEAFAPFAGSVESGMERVTRAFANWGQNLGGSQGFQKFMDYVRDNGPQLKKTIEDIGKAGESLVKAFGAFGGVNLKILDDLAKAISAIASAPGGAVVLEILALSSAVGKLAAITGLGAIITDLFRIPAAIRAFQGTEGIIGGTSAALGALGGKGAEAAKGTGAAAGGASTLKAVLPGVAAGAADVGIGLGGAAAGAGAAAAVLPLVALGAWAIAKGNAPAANATQTLNQQLRDQVAAAGPAAQAGGNLASTLGNLQTTAHLSSGDMGVLVDNLNRGGTALGNLSQDGATANQQLVADFQAVASGATGATPQIQQAARDWISAVQTVPPAAGPAGQQTGADFATGIGSTVPLTGQAVQGLKQAAASAGGGGSLAPDGASLGQSFASGISSAVGSVTSAVAGLAQAAKDAAAREHSSPWPFFVKEGFSLGDSVAIGITGAEASVVRSMQGLIGAAAHGAIAGPSSYGGLAGSSARIVNVGDVHVHLDGADTSNPSATGSAIGKEVMRSLARELRST